MFEKYGIEIAIGGGLTAVVVGGCIYLYNKNKQPENPNPQPVQQPGQQPVQNPQPGSGSGSDLGSQLGSGSNPKPTSGSGSNPNPVSNPIPIPTTGSGSGKQPVQNPQPGSGSESGSGSGLGSQLGSGSGSNPQPIPDPQTIDLFKDIGLDSSKTLPCLNPSDSNYSYNKLYIMNAYYNTTQNIIKYIYNKTHCNLSFAINGKKYTITQDQLKKYINTFGLSANNTEAAKFHNENNLTDFINNFLLMMTIKSIQPSMPISNTTGTLETTMTISNPIDADRLVTYMHNSKQQMIFYPCDESRILWNNSLNKQTELLDFCIGPINSTTDYLKFDKIKAEFKKLYNKDLTNELIKQIDSGLFDSIRVNINKYLEKQRTRTNIDDIIEDYEIKSYNTNDKAHKASYADIINKLKQPNVQGDNIKFRQNMIQILTNNLKGDKFEFNIKDTKYALSKTEMKSFTAGTNDLVISDKCHKLVDMLMSLLSINIESDKFTKIPYGENPTDTIELLYIKSIDQFICSMNTLTDENMIKLIKKIFTPLETHELNKKHLKQSKIDYEEKYKNLKLNPLNHNIISKYINLRNINTDNTTKNIFDEKLMDENIKNYTRVNSNGKLIPISNRDSLFIEIIHMHTDKDRNEIWETVVINEKKPENEQGIEYKGYGYLLNFTITYIYNNTLCEDINNYIDPMSKYLKDSLISTVNPAPIKEPKPVNPPIKPTEPKPEPVEEPKPALITDKRLTINEIRELYKSQSETLKFINDANIEASDFAVRQCIMIKIKDAYLFKKNDLIFKIDNKEYAIKFDELNKFCENQTPSEESLKNIYLFTDMYLSIFLINCKLKMHDLMDSLMTTNEDNIFKCISTKQSCMIKVLPIKNGKQIICAFADKRNDSQLLTKINIPLKNLLACDQLPDKTPTTYNEAEIETLGLNLGSYKYEDLRKIINDIIIYKNTK